MKGFAFLVGLSLIMLHATGCIREQEVHHSLQQQNMSGGVKLQVHDDPGAQVLTMRMGPINIPAQAGHMVRSRFRELFWSVPFDGWFFAYHVQGVDDNGVPIRVQPIHHMDFYNTSRRDFICPQLEEAFFAAGSEMKNWPAVPGVGYRVAKGNAIRIITMFHNPTNTPIRNIYIMVRIEYKLLTNVTSLKNIYPAWFSVRQCDDPPYDLKPGKTTTSGEFTISHTGSLLGVGGHIHNYGKRLFLENVTRKEPIATLDSKPGPESEGPTLPIVYFNEHGGYRLNRGEVIKVTATYDNPTGKLLPRGAMGLVVGYFLPDDDVEFATLKRDKR